MARTVNLEAHRVRREAFLDAAQHLIQTKGYDEMSIQDVLDQVEASRGAFYHYFDSKAALLAGVVDRYADQGLAVVAPILADPHLPAPRKLARVLAGIARFKAERRDLIVRFVEVWKSDSNALVREKVRRLTQDRMGPLLLAVVRQGRDEGLFEIESPEQTTMVLVTLMGGFQQLATDYFLARQAGAMTYEEVRQNMSAFTEAFERLLGVPRRSLTLMDEPTLRFWFD
ncbi:MAG: TetR/AcrR family transcriptional regulator [Candidatus Dormibacteraceae bacterium]